MLWHVLDVGAVVDQPALGLHVLVNFAVPLGEAPLLGDENLQKEIEVSLVFESGIEGQ